MEQIASLEKLRANLRSINLADDYSSVQDLITELHFAYECFRLGANHSVSAADQRLLWDAAYYLLTALTLPLREDHLSPLQKEEGLAISGLVFELLGRYAEANSDPDLRQGCFLNAAICNTLSRYEANSVVLANHYFDEDLVAPNPSSFRKSPSIYGMSFVFALLARKFFWIRNNAEVIGRLELHAEGAVYAPMHNEGPEFWMLICRTAVEFSDFMISGAEEHYISAMRQIINARNLALGLDALSEHWLASRLLDCVDQMARYSTWRVLREQGFSDRYISTLTRLPWSPVHELWKSQIEALTNVQRLEPVEPVNYLSEEVRRLIVSMPTSAGKTLIAEMAIVHVLERNPGAKCVYIAPNRALVDEVETKLHRRLRFLGYRVSSVGGGFESDIADPDYLNNNVDVAILTPEKFDYLLRKRDPFIENLRLMIFDEMHKVGEGYRGWFLESLITWVLLKPQLQSAKMIFMSAVLPHSQQPLIRMWLGNQSQAPIVSSEWSPTRQLIGLLWYSVPNWAQPVSQNEKGDCCYSTSASLNFRYDIGTNNRTLEGLHDSYFCVNKQKKRIKSDTRYDRCYKLIRHLGFTDSILIYFQEKQDLVRFCNRAPEYLEPSDSDHLQKLVAYVSRRLGADFPLVESLPYGVAFHHGDLPFDVRSEIERAYRDKIIRILACTTTLAEGVNLPIQTFILGYHQTQNGYHISVRDFKNIISRAGRALVETEGRVIMIRHPEFAMGDAPSQNFEKLLSPCDDDFRVESELLPSQIQDQVIAELDLLATAIHDAQSLAQQEYSEELADRIQRLQVFIFTLYEDGIITDDPDSVEAALQETLCFQGDLPHNLRNAVISLGQRFYDVCKSMETGRLRRFNMSGLRYRSNILLEELASQIAQRSRDIDARDYSFENIITSEDLKFILARIQEASPKRTEYPARHYEMIQRLDHYGILIGWLNGVDFAEIRDTFFAAVANLATRTQLCQSYISKQFTFRLPWVFSGLQVNVEPFGNASLGFWLNTLPAQVKYGVNTPEAVYLSSIGVHSRFLAIALGQLYREEFGIIADDDWESLGEWFRGLSPFYLRNRLPDLPELAVRQAIRRANAIRPPSRQIRREGRVVFDVAGWQYYAGESLLDDLWNLAIGADKPGVDLYPESKNFYDEYAVAIYWNGNKLGYVPRQHNEETALLLGLGGSLRARIMTMGAQRESGWRPVQVMIELVAIGGAVW